MTREDHSLEQILSKLRQVEEAIANGKKVALALGEIGIKEETYSRWLHFKDGLDLDQASCLKNPEQEKARPGRADAELAMGRENLKTVAAAAAFEVQY